jgi:hypothetical protein
VDANGGDVFVVAAVEDPDLSFLRRLLMDSPEEVVIELEGTGLFEAGHLDADRIGQVKNVADGPVLAARIHPLQDEKDGVLVFGVDEALQIGQLAAKGFEGGSGSFLSGVEESPLGRVHLAQFDGSIERERLE